MATVAQKKRSNFRYAYHRAEVDLTNRQIRLPGGIILDESLASDVCLAYERMCTAEYLLDTYSSVKTGKKAWDIADKVRDRMDDYGLTESEAIEEVLNED